MPRILYADDYNYFNYGYTYLDGVALIDSVTNYKRTIDYSNNTDDGCSSTWNELHEGNYRINGTTSLGLYSVQRTNHETYNCVITPLRSSCYVPRPTHDEYGGTSIYSQRYIPLLLEDVSIPITKAGIYDASGTSIGRYDQTMRLKVSCTGATRVRRLQAIAGLPAIEFGVNRDVESLVNIAYPHFTSDMSGILINGVAPSADVVHGALIWNLPSTYSCGDTFTLTPTFTGSNYAVHGVLYKIAAEMCPPIYSFYASRQSFEPTVGGNVTFTGYVGYQMDWTLQIAGRSFSGSGGDVNVKWDGKDDGGNLVAPGVYSATLTSRSPDEICTASKSLPITVISTCDLKANVTGPGSDLSFGVGGNYSITGSYTTTSSKPVNWVMSLPDGSTKSGTGLPISYTWDGTLSDGTLAPAGTYQAALTVTSSADRTCTATKALPIKVYATPDTCGLMVDFGSSAHVASGNLSYSQNLFSAKGGAHPLGLSLYYNSRNSLSASLGRGWSHNYDVSLRQNSDGSVLISEPNWKYKYYSLQNGAYVGQTSNYSTLAKKSDGTFALTAKDGQVRVFTNTGKLSSISDRNNNIISLAYNGNNLVSVTDPAGRKAIFAYDGANHLISVTDPTGNIYTFSMTGKSLASVAQPDGGDWKYTYDANAYMLTKTDPLGNVTTYAYDDRHRVVLSIDPEGRTRGIAYPQTSEAVNSTSFTEKDGGIWQYRYDTQKGTLSSKTDPQGGVTSYTYDVAGNRTSTINPDGTTTTSTYDGAGNMLTSTDALGQTTSYSYNDYGQVTSITDSQGGTTTYAYDVKGNMTSLTEATGAATTYAFDAQGNLIKITNAAGQATIFAHDAKGNLASITDPTGATTTYAYDAVGNVISITDTKGAVTQFVYDNRNRVIKAIDPQGNATLYNYDANGNKTSETDANGNTTTFEYNWRNQLIKTRDALGSVTTYAYGGNACPSCGGGADKLTSITDANGNITSYLYDLLGRSVKEADPLGNSIIHAYDARNNPTSKTDANGNTINFSYDANGRLLKKSYPDGTEETFTYDVKGHLLTAANKNISYTFSYDAAGRMLSAADSTGKVISYEYDLLGNKTKMISPEGKSLTYTYDKTNRLISIVNGGTFTFGYDAKGQRSSLTYPNGDTAAYNYDKQGSLISLIHMNAAGTVINSNSYTLDKVGNRQTNTTQDRTSSYSYDAIYRLIQALTNTPGNSTNINATKGTANAVQQQKEYFTYDPVGNRLTSATNKGYAYGPANQLISENGTTYAYDKNGNLIQKTTATETTTFAWDYENRLIKATTPTTTSEYAYDPLGRRIGKKVTESGTTNTTQFFYDNQAILFDYDETGAIGNRYLHGPNIDEPLAVTTGKEKYYYHADGLGSIIALTDATGKVVQTYDYDSFGNLKDQKSRIKQPFAYTGREWDKETGLYYYRARYYDPMEGRFISKDPIGFRGGINIYAYVLNNPINWIDPTGLLCTYSQSAGQLTCTDDCTGDQYLTCTGYAGNGDGLNNSDAQDQENVGPLPQGDYTVGAATRRRGPQTRPLTPDPNNEMHGRAGFLIHGDNAAQNHTASQGCIIVPRNCRERIPTGETLRVVP